VKKEIPNGKKSLNFSKISGFGDKLLYVSNHRGIDLKNKRGLSDKNTPMKKVYFLNFLFFTLIINLQKKNMISD
tara:strand:- start:692 stop:913 length:222 start_codon:yes stop_codon:yes gene_type:complete